MRVTPRFGILTLLIVVACASLLAWLNTRETTTISEPYYAPMIGVLRHPPPYHPKEMAVSIYIDRGWPWWHTRASRNISAHNAALAIDNYGAPNATPRVEGPWGIQEMAIPEIGYIRLAINAAIGLIILITVAIASELSISRFGSMRRPTRHGRRAESPSA